MLRKLTLGRPVPWLEQAVIALERRLNHYVTARYAKRQGWPTGPAEPQSASLPTASTALLSRQG
ncbi:MAG: hypothetical protein F6J97_21105 [Leptolyngbya sp. SIO4C1]|nr:hypothetical protein [Leptolyngbya sp. SIO4C1]